MDLVKNPDQLLNSEVYNIGFVPTMGALHEGHISLIKKSKLENTHTTVSIFVNPTQFNNSNDFQNYPITIDRDLEICRDLRVDQVFLPSPEIIYPNGYRTSIFPTSDPNGDKILCDRFRPGHFQGVLTVVNILFNLVKPKKAYFGLKDAQQLAYIQQMVSDLHMTTEVISVPTVRDSKDGLALSSRNARLNVQERQIASIIPEVLRNISQKQTTLEEGFKVLVSKDIKVDYLEVRTFPDLKSVKDNYQMGQRVFFAGYVGLVRLIDNMEISR